MNANIITDTAKASHSGSISFPDAIGKLMAAGVEYYHVDYITLQTTYYSAEGSVVVAPLPYENLPAVSSTLNIQELKAAILDSQINNQTYRRFSERVISAGVQSYFTFLSGKRVVYIGRQGDQHTEWFPGAKPENV